MTTRTKFDSSDVKNFLIKLVVWVVLALNVVAIGASMYLFRYAVYCGLGIGVYAVLMYVPTLVLVAATYFYNGGRVVIKIRNYIFVLNGLYFALLLFQGTCFSCVDACVESYQGG